MCLAVFKLRLSSSAPAECEKALWRPKVKSVSLRITWDVSQK